MTDTLEVLKDKELKLTPFESKLDFDYLCSLIEHYKYNTIGSYERMRELLDRYGREYWTGSSGVYKLGVIFLMYLAEMDEWTLDAYDDIQNKQIADPKGDFSYRAGKLIIDYFFRTHDVKILTTRHDIRNRAATVVCKRLGFKVTGKIYLTDIGEHIVMRLERPYGN